jgi:PilZ domain
MDLRAAVRITVQLKAQLALDAWGCGDAATVTELRAGTIEGMVEDLSRGGLFLRTADPLKPMGKPRSGGLAVPRARLSAIDVGAAGIVRLTLPEEALDLRGEVVRVERGERCGLGLRFVGPLATRRALANFLMQCHATCAFPMRAHGD